jgi:hypothetical protein
VLLVLAGLGAGPLTAASAATCATPRVVSSSYGPARSVSTEVCTLSLTAGANVLRWDRPVAPADDVLSTIPSSARSAGLSVWHFDPGRRRWTAWGDAVPTGLPTLDRIDRGAIYFVDAPFAADWSLPAPFSSVFDGAQVVSFYGFPGIPSMGALGSHSPAAAIEAVRELAAEYDALNGDLDVIPAVHPIVAVAQPVPLADGSYLGRMHPDTISSYVEAARDANALVFLDIQIGWSDPLAEVKRLEPFLTEPFVHIALDPEFSTAARGVAPGQVIGSLDAARVNEVQAYLAGLVRERGLPPKVIVLHQFDVGMLNDPDEYTAHDEVEILIDMDGFGGVGIKTRHYTWYALASYAERPGIKLFFNWDTPLMSPAAVMGLPTPPALVIYQ